MINDYFSKREGISFRAHHSAGLFRIIHFMTIFRSSGRSSRRSQQIIQNVTELTVYVCENLSLFSNFPRRYLEGAL